MVLMTRRVDFKRVRAVGAKFDYVCNEHTVGRKEVGKLEVNTRPGSMSMVEGANFFMYMRISVCRAPSLGGVLRGRLGSGSGGIGAMGYWWVSSGATLCPAVLDRTEHLFVG